MRPQHEHGLPGVILILITCHQSIAWVGPEQALSSQPHFYDISIRAKVSRLFLEASYAQLGETLHLVDQMAQAPVFYPVRNDSQYFELGNLWNYLFKYEVGQINSTIYNIMHDITFLIDSNPLLRKEGFLSKDDKCHCKIEVGLDPQMLKRFHQLVSYLASNWLSPQVIFSPILQIAQYIRFIYKLPRLPSFTIAFLGKMNNCTFQ